MNGPTFRLLAAVLIAAALPSAAAAQIEHMPAPPPPPAVAAPTCTVAAPCRINVLFAYTSAGLEQLRLAADGQRDQLARVLPDPARAMARLRTCFASGRHHGVCLLNEIKVANVRALANAFQVSGITDIAGTHASIVFAGTTWTGQPIDTGDSVRQDAVEAYGSWPSFNSCMLAWLGGTDQARDWNRNPIQCRRQDRSAWMQATGRSQQIVVVFTGAHYARGGCGPESAANAGIIVTAACQAVAYDDEENMVLHEVGHVFGAWHNDNAGEHGQRCTQNDRGCAWEACLRRSTTCTPDNLVFAQDAFCTLVGQSNYLSDFNNHYSHCAAHRGGENGSGWIREYSHPGLCHLAGFTHETCGDDDRHNAVAEMRRMAPWVAAMRAGCPRVNPRQAGNFAVDCTSRARLIAPRRT